MSLPMLQPALSAAHSRWSLKVELCSALCKSTGNWNSQHRCDFNACHSNDTCTKRSSSTVAHSLYGLGLAAICTPSCACNYQRLLRHS